MDEAIIHGQKKEAGEGCCHGQETRWEWKIILELQIYRGVPCNLK